MPLSGEIAINDATRLLKLELPAEPIAGADAIRRNAGKETLVQIKGRVLFSESKSSPRLDQLKLEQPWDETELVLVNEDYEPQEIYVAGRELLELALNDKPQYKRGAMTIVQFRIIAKRVWSAGDGVEAASL